MKNLRVVHINTSGVGGAAIACHRLHHLMKDHGVQSDVIHLYNNHKAEKGLHSIGYSFVRRISNRLVYYLNQKDLTPDAFVFSELSPLSSNIARHQLVLQSDVIYLHWVQGGFFSKSDFEDIAKLSKPVFCITHDMWWVTGGCHHTFECEKYQKGCSSCDKHIHFKLLTHRQYTWKKNFYNKYPNVCLISPSNWLKHCAEISGVIEPNKCYAIPNVVPDKIFKTMDKSLARKSLGLPQNKIIISFGTADNSNKIKGFIYLKQALQNIHHENILLCVYGSDYDENLVHELPCQVRFLGRISDPEQIAVANAASDLFISPSIAESFGLTLLENIKCGTPVISTNATAIPEIVKDGINGYIVKPKNSEQIKDAILSFVDKPLIIDGTFDDIFSDDSILDKHLRLIQQVLDDK